MGSKADMKRCFSIVVSRVVLWRRLEGSINVLVNAHVLAWTGGANATSFFEIEFIISVDVVEKSGWFLLVRLTHASYLQNNFEWFFGLRDVKIMRTYLARSSGGMCSFFVTDMDKGIESILSIFKILSNSLCRKFYERRVLLWFRNQLMKLYDNSRNSNFVPSNEREEVVLPSHSFNFVLFTLGVLWILSFYVTFIFRTIEWCECKKRSFLTEENGIHIIDASVIATNDKMRLQGRKHYCS